MGPNILNSAKQRRILLKKSENADCGLRSVSITNHLVWNRISHLYEVGKQHENRRTERPVNVDFETIVPETEESQQKF
jgi:hypothetical protein